MSIIIETIKRIVITIVISILYFYVLFHIANSNFFTNQSESKFEPLHLLIALIPFIIFLIVSGKLKEIRGPGGIGFSFRDEVQKPLSPEFLEVDKAIVMPKEDTEELRNRISKIQPEALSFEVGKKSYYEWWAIEEYIKELKSHSNFRYILLTDANRKFKGCIKISDFEDLLQTGEEIVQKLESGQILSDNRVIKNSLKINSTNKQALNEMDRANVSLLPVVNHERKFIGIVTQEEIVRKILTKVLSEA